MEAHILQGEEALAALLSIKRPPTPDDLPRRWDGRVVRTRADILEWLAEAAEVRAAEAAQTQELPVSD